MTPFLKLVANDVFERFHGHLENVAVVFPNKRAGLFFNKYLLDKSNNKPIWSPRYMTINELFQQGSDLAIGDPILLVSKLYKVYIEPYLKAGKKPETLDSFYYWGEMLIRDFDDIDKNLVDAKILFSNIEDLRKLGTGKDILTKEQAESVEQFFNNFKPENDSEIKSNFKDIWERLYDIYTKFKESLRENNIAYEGMLYRDMIEHPEMLNLEYKNYVFVGFNALNGVETKLFKILKNSDKALFYWDYDVHYVNNSHHEAGHFMRENFHNRFENALKDVTFDNLKNEKNVSVVSAGNNSIQARYLSQWLDANLTEQEIETAVVLCDETMLEPILHTIPEKANGHDLKYLNVTMGYPISSTPVYSLIKHLIELQIRGWSEKRGAFCLTNVSNILKHPYVIAGSENSLKLRETLMKGKRFFPTESELHADEFLKRIFTRYTDNKEWMESIASLVFDIANIANKDSEGNELYNKLFCEATLKVHTQVQRMIHLFENGELNLEQSTAGRLLVRLLSMQSMPFHGEPVVGLQVMGLLETRNLDFKNVIMLSVNEGNIPKGKGENSYIPYNLRRAFGLTLSEHRDSIYAYNFYRLLQRAQNVTLVYNNSADSRGGGECSRYILQLEGSNLYKIDRLALSAEQSCDTVANGEVPKTEAMIETLRKRFDKGYNKNAGLLTPSAINRYLKCGLSFFYYYILGLKPAEEIDVEMLPTDFGVVFHKAAEDLYNSMTQRDNVIDRQSIDRILEQPLLLYRIIDDAFKETFFKGGTPVYNGEQYINRDMLKRFLTHLLNIDKTAASFNYICGEGIVGMPHSIVSNGNTIDLEIGGTIDRIDVKDDTVNIIDYKTGGGARDTKTSLDDIFAHEGKSSGYRLQSFLYSVVIDKLLTGSPVNISGGGYDWGKALKSLKPTKVSPHLIYVHKETGDVNRNNYIVDVENNAITDITTIEGEFMERLNGVLEEIFDKEKKFTPTCDEKRCEYCDYKKICGK